MTFKVDENLPVEAAELLREAGYDADTVEDEGLNGADDTVIAARVRDEGRAVVTLDLGFSDVRAYPPQDYAGIVVIRSKRQDKPTLLELVRRFIPALTTEQLEGRLWIVEMDQLRIREGLPR